MKFRTVLLTILFSACALIGVVLLGGLPSIPVRVTEPPAQRRNNSTPKVQTSGPQPKAVADEISFDFGRAIVGDEYSHIFTLRNEGKAPLTLKKGKSTCQCTVSSFEEGKEKLEVPAGESVEITLTWKPKEVDDSFSHAAEIITDNDPNSEKITFEIHGRVVDRIVTMPLEIWKMPEIYDDAPTKFFGKIASPALEDFQITGLKTTHPLLAAKHFKLSKTELAQYDMKSGFRIDLELQQGIPVGAFNESIMIATNVENDKTYTVSVRSHRYGPITIRPIIKCLWNPTKLGLNMRDFPASEGRTSILHLYARGMDGKDLEFRDIEIDPEYLQFSFTPDDSFSGKGSKRYVLTFKIPPGSPKASRGKETPARVHLKTNHPEVSEMNILVHFISR
jgi:hypothetical protein